MNHANPNTVTVACLEHVAFQFVDLKPHTDLHQPMQTKRNPSFGMNSSMGSLTSVRTTSEYPQVFDGAKH